MGALPREIVRVLRVFEDVFSERIWDWVQVLVVGAILTPGQRTVASVLRVMGLSDERQYQNYHRVLNRARWSSREVSRRLLVACWSRRSCRRMPRSWSGWTRRSSVGAGRRSRRRGSTATRCGRASATSSRPAGCAGSRCRCWPRCPWAGRIWGLPFLTVLAPSERYHLERGRRHKTLPDWGRQMIRQLRRWLPDRALVVVADSTYAVLELLADAARLPQPVTVVTRLRLDAALYDPAPPREPGTHGAATRQRRAPTDVGDPPARSGHPLGDADRPLVRRRDRAGGGRRPAPPSGTTPASRPVALRWVLLRDPAGQFDPQALLSTDPTVAPPRSSPGSSPAGRWKSPSMRSALISASRPSANGRTSPSSAPPRPCSASSRW